MSGKYFQKLKSHISFNEMIFIPRNLTLLKRYYNIKCKPLASFLFKETTLSRLVMYLVFYNHKVTIN